MSESKVGNKYQIEVAEVFEGNGSNKLYRMVGFNTLIFDEHGLSKLQPANDSYNAYQDGYEEGHVVGYNKGKEEAEKKAYEKGMKDMYKAMLWSARNSNAITPKEWAINLEDVQPEYIFETYKKNVINKVTDAIGSYLKKNLIEVGDEVSIDYLAGSQRGIVTKICNQGKDGYYCVLMNDGDIGIFEQYNVGTLIHKTGRKYNMDFVLKELRGENDE